LDADNRSFRLAVVADELVNAPPPGLDVVGVLDEHGWGLIVLPPSWYGDDVASDLLVQVAEHIEEFVRHNYRVVCIGGCEALALPLSELGVAMPDTIKPGRDEELRAALEEHR
jgi:hypothetical protein